MRKGRDKGSMMVEAVLVLPIFVLTIFFIIQISLVWTAKQLTYYAAYCAARAAMVYNPAEYNSVATSAARGVLSWMSWSTSAFSSFTEHRVGDYAVPLSGNVKGQVSVSIEEFSADGNSNKSNKSNNSSNSENGSEGLTYPAVRATVTFKFPLFIPFGGPVVAYFFGAALNGVSTDGALTNVYSPTNPSAAVSGLDFEGDIYKIPLVESCTLAKPYKTETFPLMSSGDKTLLGVDK